MFLPQGIRNYVKAHVPIEQQETVLGILVNYPRSADPDPAAEAHTERVLLAALTLAGGNLGQLKAYVEVAAEDEAELLGWAAAAGMH